MSKIRLSIQNKIDTQERGSDMEAKKNLTTKIDLIVTSTTKTRPSSTSQKSFNVGM